MMRIAVLPAKREASAPSELTEVEEPPFSYTNKNTSEFTKKVDEPEEPEDFINTPIFKAFLPLMASLKFLGLFHYRKIDKSKTKTGFSMPSFSQMYSWSLTGTAWVVTIKSAITMRLASGLGPQLITNMIFTFVLLLCTMNCTSFLLASHNPKSVRKMFLGFSKLKMYGGPFADLEKVRKYALFGAISAWIMNIISYGIVILIAFWTDVLNTLSTDPLTDSPIGALVMKLVFVGGAFYMSSMFVFGAFVDLNISLLIFYELRLFGKNFRSRLTEDGSFNGSLENERRRYLLLARIVDAANDCLAIHHGASFACGIANICLLLYSIIYYPSVSRTVGVALAYSFWIICAVFDMTVSCACGILINAAVCIT